MTMLKYNHLVKNNKVMQEAAVSTEATADSGSAAVDTAVEITLDLVGAREIEDMDRAD